MLSCVLWVMPLQNDPKLDWLMIHAQATVAGIEVLLPALLRINSGSADSFTDAAGNVWAADTGFIGTFTSHAITLCMLLNFPEEIRFWGYNCYLYHMLVPALRARCAAASSRLFLSCLGCILQGKP